MSTHESRRDAALNKFATDVLTTFTSAEYHEHEDEYMSDGECLDLLLASFRDNLLMYVGDAKLRNRLTKLFPRTL